MEYQITVEATGDLTGNKSANKITKVSRNSLQNNPETITNEHDKEIPKERYISPEERQKIIDDFTLIWCYNNGISKKKKKNLLDNTTNQPSTFKTKNWVEKKLKLQW